MKKIETKTYQKYSNKTIMCDISSEENKAINIQLSMNIPLNRDVLSVIKSFVFEDKKVYIQKKLQKQRKDEAMRTINSSMGYDLREYISDEGNLIGHWAIWLPPSEEYYNDFQIQASSCFKCGKYVQVSTWDLERAIIDNQHIVCVNGQH